jgi:hypothetical protein
LGGKKYDLTGYFGNLPGLLDRKVSPNKDLTGSKQTCQVFLYVQSGQGSIILAVMIIILPLFMLAVLSWVRTHGDDKPRGILANLSRGHVGLGAVCGQDQQVDRPSSPNQHSDIYRNPASAGVCT